MEIATIFKVVMNRLFLQWKGWCNVFASSRRSQSRFEGIGDVVKNNFSSILRENFWEKDSTGKGTVKATDIFFGKTRWDSKGDCVFDNLS